MVSDVLAVITEGSAPVAPAVPPTGRPGERPDAGEPAQRATPAGRRGSASLGVSIRVRGQLLGGLYLTDKQNAAGFTTTDTLVVSALASLAGIAIERARQDTHVRALTLAEERDRIARELHDSVIQRLFGVGLVLQGMARHHQGTGGVRMDPQLERAIADIDETVQHIRTAIFDLEDIARGQSVREEIVAEVREAASAFGLDPRLTLRGPIDITVRPPVTEHLVSALREALTNVGRHASARSVAVSVHAGDQLTLEVRDDGVGLVATGTHSGGRGLRNLSYRAESLGGSCDLSSQPDAGTVVRWVVPL